MGASIVIGFDKSNGTGRREHKGESIIAFPVDYTVVDLETTGLDPYFDTIIEISALRVRANKIVDTLSTLVKPMWEVSEFITGLTGITNEMLADAPMLKEVLPAVREFIGDDIIVGHNVNFDVNFLYDVCLDILGTPFSNNFLDTLRLSRKALPDLAHHRLDDVAQALGIVAEGHHRALSDCKTTFNCYLALEERIHNSIGIDSFIESFSLKKYDLRTIHSDKAEFDETHPLYGKRCTFTGTLERMARSDAAQIVTDFGGICDNGVTKKTNYLILGNNDYCNAIKGGKSNKQKKAEAYKLDGLDIEIIPENVFYDMIEL